MPDLHYAYCQTVVLRSSYAPIAVSFDLQSNIVWAGFRLHEDLIRSCNLVSGMDLRLGLAGESVPPQSDGAWTGVAGRGVVSLVLLSDCETSRRRVPGLDTLVVW